MFWRPICANHAYKLHIRKEARCIGKMGRRTPQQVITPCLRRFDVINSNRTDYEKGHSKQLSE